MTTEQDIVQYVKNYRPSKGMNPVPGLPISHLLIEDRAALRRLVDAGTVRLVDVTKPSKLDATKTTTYTYIVLA